MTDGAASEREPRLGRALLIALAGLVCLFALAYGVRVWRHAGGPAMGPPPPLGVPAIIVAAEALPQSLDAIGSLQAVRQVTLASEVAGRVTAIRFASGDTVPAGAVLVQLYDAPERADRAVAQSRARFAQLNYRRSQQLVPTGAASAQELEQNQDELAQAEASVQQIDARLVQKTIRAPFAGQIGLRRVDLGQYLSAGDPIATLTDLDRLYVNFSVPQQALSKLRIGGAVEIHIDAYPDRRFVARLNAIEPVVGGDTRNVSAQAILANPDHALRPGLFASVRIVQPPRPGAILLPDTAIQTSASGDSVLVVRGRTPMREGAAQAVAVTTGEKVGDRVVVESGLVPGDVVIPYGQLRIQPGAAVRVTPGAPR
jgi:multidrug efflux system membrane fusion protein